MIDSTIFRRVAARVRDALSHQAAVALIGPRQVGKTISVYDERPAVTSFGCHQTRATAAAQAFDKALTVPLFLRLLVGNSEQTDRHGISRNFEMGSKLRYPFLTLFLSGGNQMPGHQDIGGHGIRLALYRIAQTPRSQERILDYAVANQALMQDKMRNFMRYREPSPGPRMPTVDVYRKTAVPSFLFVAPDHTGCVIIE
jgi:hypothetical protein